MGDIRKSAPADPGASSRGVVSAVNPDKPGADAFEGIESGVAAALDRHVPAHARIAVALSGGRDSVALLVAAHRVASGRVVAVHVDHGISAHAQAWARFCTGLTRSLDIPLTVRRVDVPIGSGKGLEAAARDARYAALADGARTLRAGAVVLAHHQDDQAETLLLQLARGAGPHGLAGMPAMRIDADGLRWLRPWLAVPRAKIEAYVQARGLAHVDDDSNASRKHRRNALRHDVLSAFAATFPGYPATIARAAGHQAEAAQLADDLAALDAAPLLRAGMLDSAGLAALSPHRARNLLRHFLRLHGLAAASSARLAAMLDQLSNAREDARVRLLHEGVELGIHRGRIVVHAPAEPRSCRAWNGEPVLTLGHGSLVFTPVVGEGVARDSLLGRSVTVRTRMGGERIRLALGRPRRTLKSLLREAGVPEWERQMLPLLFCDDALAAVPGIGVDVAFATASGAAGICLHWQREG